jgi:hypothetical protein
MQLCPTILCWMWLPIRVPPWLQPCRAAIDKQEMDVWTLASRRGRARWMHRAGRVFWIFSRSCQVLSLFCAHPPLLRLLRLLPQLLCGNPISDLTELCFAPLRHFVAVDLFLPSTCTLQQQQERKARTADRTCPLGPHIRCFRDRLPNRISRPFV